MFPTNFLTAPPTKRYLFLQTILSNLMLLQLYFTLSPTWASDVAQEVHGPMITQKSGCKWPRSGWLMALRTRGEQLAGPGPIRVFRRTSIGRRRDAGALCDILKTLRWGVFCFSVFYSIHNSMIFSGLSVSEFFSNFPVVFKKSHP